MRFVFTLLFLGFVAAGLAQKPKADSKPAPPQAATTDTKQNQQPSSGAILTQHFLRKYAMAARWNDYDVAKEALYDLIVENPNNDSIIFTLGYYYYENQKYASSLLIAQDLLQRDPKNISYLELAGAASESLGVYDRALQNYESLYLLTNNVGTLYKISFLQFDLKRFNECQTNTDILMTKAEMDTLKVVFNDAEEKPKEYSMKVSVLNLRGLVAQEMGDKAAARQHFEAALALAHDFIPAKQNLSKLK
jgi:tetratricopeptide (TPR) repeat protein